LIGIDVSIVDSQIHVGPDNEFRISVDAFASQVAKYNSAEDLWEIDIGPSGENEATGFILTQMMFAQLMLKSEPGEQQLELTSAIPIKLPEGATLLNADNLSGARWRINFGGGTYREAWISLEEGQREVVLSEKLVVTENPPTAPEENLAQAPWEYRVFTIKYRLPGNSHVPVVDGAGSGKDESGSNNFSWTFDWSISREFSQTFSHAVGDVTAEAGVTADLGFTFKWYIGWDLDWAWEWPPCELQWFRTYLEIGPELDVDLSASITGEIEKSWDKDIYHWSKWVWIWIGPVPVGIEARLDLDAGVDASAKGNLTLGAGVDAKTVFKLGVEWTKDEGWEPIAERDFSFSLSLPELDISAEASVTPFVKLRLGAYFYGTAGPFGELKPLVTAGLEQNSADPSVINWSIKTGFDINAGVGFGAISDWVALPDWSKTLYSWRTTLASGSWGGEKAATRLAVQPSAPTLAPGENITLVATLTSNGSLLANKPISWSTTDGSLSPTSGNTDNAGQISVVYTAPSYETSTTITASFAGDDQYHASSVAVSRIISSGWQISVVDSAGEVGYASSIALDASGYPHISYFDETNGDLKYARWDGGSWRIETVDFLGYVGDFTSLSLDAKGYPHISYARYGGIELYDLKYARWTGSEWDIQTVDSEGNVGLYTSMALDANGYPHISYFDRTNESLKYARWTGSEWDIQTVDSEGNVGLYTSMALDANGYPHISYFETNGPLEETLKYARWTGLKWDIQTVDSGWVGRYTSIALDASGYPHISYYESLNYDLKYARWTGSEWDIQTVDSVGKVGRYTSIALDANGYPHISYLEEPELLTYRLKYARWTGSAWSIQVIDFLGRFIDDYTSIALDANGYPHTSYLGANYDLKYARWAELVWGT
jgi:hypothetical protein